MHTGGSLVPALDKISEVQNMLNKYLLKEEGKAEQKEEIGISRGLI